MKQLTILHNSKKGTKNEENYFCIKTIVAFDILLKVQSPEWEYGTRNLDSVAWQTVSY